jgi:hypothetical protein
MTNKTPLRDLIVILPGITGSVLQKDGEDFWGVSGQAIWDIFKSGGKTLEALKVKQDDPNASDLGDGVKAIRLVEDVQIIPGLFKVDGYTQTTKMFIENFSSVIQGNIYNDPEDKAANLYHFPYDWRRDNRASARILQTLLNQRLKRWREYSGNQKAKVILLAHSMGGLVSRYYLEVLGGWQDCKALFTFGTPYRGSLNAVDFLANGYKKAIFDLSEALRSMNSVYQLLPRYKVLKIGNDFHRIAESPVTLPNIDLAKAKDALNFHNEIDDAADTNKKDPSYQNTFVTCPIVGVQQPTKQSAELLNGTISTNETLPTWLSNRSHLSDGDGTVPQVSATPVQMNDLELLAITDYIAETHGSLQKQPNILENLLKVIQAAETITQSDVRGSLESVIRGKRSGQKGIGLSLDDLYLTNEPITLRAKVSEGASFNQLTAEITSVNSDRPPIIGNFTLENGTWVMATDNLAGGLYRVKVQTDNASSEAPNPVHDVFAVVNLGE